MALTGLQPSPSAQRRMVYDALADVFKAAHRRFEVVVVKRYSCLPLLVIAVLVVSLFTLACGDDDGGAVSPGGPFGDNKTAKSGVRDGSSGSGSCEVKVTGDQQLTFSGKAGPGAVGSDYWFTDDDLRQTFTALKNDKESVEAALKKDPRLYLLIVNCNQAGGGGTLSLIPSNTSKYKDVPFKPADYVISKQGALSGAKNPGEFTALLNLAKGGFNVSEPGKLQITKFDKSGIAGTFTFKAEEFAAEGTPKKVNVEGKFDFSCPGGGSCKK
ncbi:MAG: hypothetical protein ABI939_05915 [Anaerolineaceae bacterium]